MFDREKGKSFFRIFLFLVAAVLILFAFHSTWTISTAYSTPSIVFSSDFPDGSRLIFDDFREGFSWLRHNTNENDRILSWWDYGYQISGMANRTVIVDNNTWNNSHIALVGKALASDELDAFSIVQKLDVEFVLVIFGGLIGYGGDDIDKLLWMIRIAQGKTSTKFDPIVVKCSFSGEFPEEIREENFLFRSELRVDRFAPSSLLKSLLYKLCYYRFAEIDNGPSFPSG